MPDKIMWLLSHNPNAWISRGIDPINTWYYSIHANGGIYLSAIKDQNGHTHVPYEYIAAERRYGPVIYKWVVRCRNFSALPASFYPWDWHTF